MMHEVERFLREFGWLVLIGVYLLVKVLTRHQQRMTELIHTPSPSALPEIDRLRAEVAELRRASNEQALEIDGLKRVRQLPSVEESQR